MEDYANIFMNTNEAAKYLKCDPYSLRSQAQDDPSKLGFPVMVIGQRVKIPRWSFFKFLGIEEPK